MRRLPSTDYVWHGDLLLDGQTGALVATVDDFPQLVRLRNLREREARRRLEDFNRRHPALAAVAV